MRPTISYSMFFDRAAIRREVGTANVRNLRRAGGLVRKIGRRSIKYRKSRDKVSTPGNPPFAHTTGMGIKTILYGYDRARESVVVGFAKLSGTKDPGIPERLEKGGRARIVVRKRAKRSARRDARGRYKKRSKAELERIRRYYQQRGAVAGVTEKKSVAIRPRPTQVPALETAKKKFPELWKDSVKSTQLF